MIFINPNIDYLGDQLIEIHDFYRKYELLLDP
jgi:hypothetical protein